MQRQYGKNRKTADRRPLRNCYCFDQAAIAACLRFLRANIRQVDTIMGKLISQ